MPLYLVKNNETKALVAVEAATKAQAVNHVVNGAFTATVVRDPLESVRLMKSGVAFEKASDEEGGDAEETSKPDADADDAAEQKSAADAKAADAAADETAAKAKAAGV